MEKIPDRYSMECFKDGKWKVFGYEDTPSDAMGTVSLVQGMAEESGRNVMDWRVCRVSKEVIFVSTAKPVGPE